MEMEEEIANLYVNTIKNGLTAGYIINVPNGISWDPETKKEFEKAIKAKLTGSPNGGTFVIAFNGGEEPVTVEAIPINASVHKQWEYLTQEARQQILTAHRVTSPMLFGIKDNTGFGNNAEELDTAEAQLMKRVVAPKQNFILDAIEEVLDVYGINLSLEFLPLTEVAEVAEVDNVELSSQELKPTDDLANELIQLGEDLSADSWTLLSTSDVDYETDDDIFGLLEFASTGTARPNAKSSQDSEDIAIRYRYAGNPLPERTFCRLMMAANKLYRKEDILQMEKSTTNPGFGMGTGGQKPYSIWLWKGGGKMSTAFPNGTCKHKWQREIYLKKGGSVDVNSPLAKTISTSEARRKGYKVPVNDSDVSITPNNNK